MTKKLKDVVPRSRRERIVSLLGSRTFFWGIVGLFCFQAIWIALTARYPMAFDEQFHFGVITIYSHHLSPLLTTQPAGADQFGALTADPSYLYQYLLSFPLRLIRLFTADQTIQIICLRLLNIAFFACGLIVFRKLFRLAKTSEALSNILLLCFVLTPVVPMLAAEINYDNLVVPLTALAIYLTAWFSQRVRAEGVWSWVEISKLLSLCLVTSLVKYAFIPVFIGLVIWVWLDWLWLRRHKPMHNTQARLQPKHSLRLAGYGLLLVVSMLLFTQRYGLNVVRYHTPTPECDQVLSIVECQEYSPWARNYTFSQQRIHLPLNQKVTYPVIWIYHALNELTFSITSRFDPSGAIVYFVAPQLIVIEILSWLVFGLGVVAVLWYGRQLLRERLLRLFVLVSALYAAALAGLNFIDYLHLGYPVAIHGRYLLPILPLIFLLVARAFGMALRDLPLGRSGWQTRKLAVSGFVVIILLVEGGGFGTYIIRSRPDWAWPQSRTAQDANSAAQSVLRPFVVNIGS